LPDEQGVRILPSDEMIAVRDQMFQVRDELRELLSEAHGVSKDLNRLIREAKQEISKLAYEEIEKQMSQALGEAVKAGLDEYQSRIKEAVDRATDAVFKRFDILTAIMMGRGKQNADLTKIATEDTLAAARRQFRKEKSLG